MIFFTTNVFPTLATQDDAPVATATTEKAIRIDSGYCSSFPNELYKNYSVSVQQVQKVRRTACITDTVECRKKKQKQQTSPTLHCRSLSPMCFETYKSSATVTVPCVQTTSTSYFFGKNYLRISLAIIVVLRHHNGSVS